MSNESDEEERNDQIVIEGGKWYPASPTVVVHTFDVGTSSMGTRELIDELETHHVGSYVMDEKLVDKDGDLSIYENVRYVLFDSGNVEKRTYYVGRTGNELGSGHPYNAGGWKKNKEIIGGGKVEIVSEEQKDLPENGSGKYKLIIEPLITPSVN